MVAADGCVSSPTPTAPASFEHRWWKGGKGSTGSFTDVKIADHDPCDPCLAKRNAESCPSVMSYPQFAWSAARNHSLFSIFRQHYMSFGYAGIEVCGPYPYNNEQAAQKLLNLLLLHVPNFADWLPTIERMDKIGSGTTFLLSHASGTARVSGTLLRYFKFATDLKALFGDLKGKHLIEIGIGFGGQAAAIAHVFPELGSYTLLDLPEPLRLAQTYIKHARPSTPTDFYFLNANPCKESLTDQPWNFQPLKYDLVFSTHAFQELPMAVKQLYGDKVLRGTPRGFMTDFARSGHTRLPELIAKENGDAVRRNMLVFSDVMNLYRFTPKFVNDRFEAIVAWGVSTSGYYPGTALDAAVQKLTAASTYRKMYKQVQMHG